MLIQKPQELTTGPNTVTPLYPKPSISSDSTAITLVESIIKENSTLKDQISHIEAELYKGRHISDKLLNENKMLRQLYTGRTADIAKLLKSIMIQTDQEKVDYQHQCHLIRELNFATLRQIKNLDQQRRQADERLEEKKKGIFSLVEHKNVLQNEELNSLKARIRNGISPQATQKAKKLYEEECERNRALEQEVDHLLILNTKVRGELRQLSKSEQLRRDSILVEKYECEQALVNLKQENKRYQGELVVDKIELEKAEEDRNHKEQRYTNILKGLNEEIKKYEKNQRVFNQINSEREKCRVGILASTEAQATLNRQLDKIRQEKEDLLKQIKNRKRKIANSKEEWMQREEAFRQDHRQSLIKISSQISKQQSSFEEEKAKIITERNKVENQTNLHKNQLESLEERIAQYSRLIKERPNPIYEIEKIELGLRLKRR